MAQDARKDFVQLSCACLASGTQCNYCNISSLNAFVTCRRSHELRPRYRRERERQLLPNAAESYEHIFRCNGMAEIKCWWSKSVCVAFFWTELYRQVQTTNNADVLPTRSNRTEMREPVLARRPGERHSRHP